MTAATEVTSPRSVIRRNGGFRRLWLGQSVSLLGDQVSLIAFPLIAVLALHVSPAQMGLLTAAQVAPSLLFSLPAGKWVDGRGHHRRLMIACDLARAVTLCGIPIAYAAGSLTLDQLYVTAFVTGSFSLVFRVAYPTLMTSMLERDDYVSANQWYNGSRAVAYMAGPSAGGFLVQALSGPAAILVDACSFLGSALFLRRTPDPPPPPADDRDAKLLDGLRLIWNDGLLRPSLVASTVLNLANYAALAIYILFLSRVLHFRPGPLGLVLGAGAVGGLIGSLLTKRAARRLGLGWAYIAGFFMFSVPVALIPAAGGSKPTEYGMVFAAEFLSGMGVMLLDILGGSLFQAVVPDRLRARFTGAFMMVNYGIRPIGALAGGALASTFGLRSALWVTVAVGAASGLVLVASPTRLVRDLPDAG